MSIASLGQTLLVSGTISLGILCLYTIVNRMPQLTIFILLAFTIISTPNFNLHVGWVFMGANVYPLDILSLIFMLVGLIGAIKSPRWDVCTLCIAILTTTTILGVLVWIQAYGMRTGVNHWRLELYSLSVYWWANSRQFQVEHLRKPFITMASVAVACEIYFGLRYGFNSAIDGYYDAELHQSMDGRPLDSPSTFIILCGLIILITTRRGSSRTQALLTGLFLCALLLAQQRTVWLSTCAAAVYGLFVVIPKLKLTGRVTLPLITIAALVAPFLYFGYYSSSSLVTSSTNTHTLDARIGFWTDRLAFSLTPDQWLFGEILGPTPVSLAPGWEFSIQAHNMYVQTLNQNGLIGLMLLIVAVIYRLRSSILAVNHAVSLLIIAIIAFGIAYSFPDYTLIFLAALSLNAVSPVPVEQNSGQVGRPAFNTKDAPSLPTPMQPPSR